MKDSKNLKKKLKEYRIYLKEAFLDNDYYHVLYWSDQIGLIKDELKKRAKNKAKNIKQYKKAN